MSEIIPFPIQRKQASADLETVIDKALSTIPEREREKIRFDLIRTVDGYDAFFTEWSLSIPGEGNETLKKQIYDIAHQEHDRKMRMLADIIRLKIQVLVAQYHQRQP